MTTNPTKEDLAAEGAMPHWALHNEQAREALSTRLFWAYAESQGVDLRDLVVSDPARAVSEEDRLERELSRLTDGKDHDEVVAMLAELGGEIRDLRLY